jgi:hypothetical protein
MKRITPEDVVDAYIATGLYPAFKRWKTRDGRGGCGLTAIGGLNGHCVKSGRRYEKFSKLLGLDQGYLYGFTAGFDGSPFCPAMDCQTKHYGFDHEKVTMGLEDGLAARAAVKAHFAKVKADQQAPEPEPACSVR